MPPARKALESTETPTSPRTVAASTGNTAASRCSNSISVPTWTPRSRTSVSGNSSLPARIRLHAGSVTTSARTVCHAHNSRTSPGRRIAARRPLPTDRKIIAKLPSMSESGPSVSHA